MKSDALKTSARYSFKADIANKMKQNKTKTIHPSCIKGNKLIVQSTISVITRINEIIFSYFLFVKNRMRQQIVKNMDIIHEVKNLLCRFTL